MIVGKTLREEQGMMPKVFGQYVGILAMLLIAVIIGAVMVTGSWLFGPKKVSSYKNAAYECGVEPVGNARERFPIKFYLVGILFILFDIEVIFLWSWISIFKHATPAFQKFTFFEFITYMSTWIISYLYVIRVGAIDWDETVSLDSSKLTHMSPIQESELEPIGVTN